MSYTYIYTKAHTYLYKYMNCVCPQPHTIHNTNTIYVRVCTYIDKNTHTHTYMYLNIHIYIYIYIHILINLLLLFVVYLKLCVLVDVLGSLSVQDELGLIGNPHNVVLHGVTQQPLVAHRHKMCITYVHQDLMRSVLSLHHPTVADAAGSLLTSRIHIKTAPSLIIKNTPAIVFILCAILHTIRPASF